VATASSPDPIIRLNSKMSMMIAVLYVVFCVQANTQKLDACSAYIAILDRRVAGAGVSELLVSVKYFSSFSKFFAVS